MLNHKNIYQLYDAILGLGSTDTLYGLVDHVGMPGLTKKLTQAGAQWISLFDGSKEEGALLAAPILFKIENDGGRKLPRVFLDWVGEHGTYTSSMLFLTSSLPMPELARRLALRLDAVLPEGVDVLFRYFDPRIFEMLRDVLSIEQRQGFLGVASNWWVVDRRGVLQKIVAKFSEKDDFDAPLKLTVQQERNFLDSSEPDQIAQLLQSEVSGHY
jgi:hypothetical protein